ncbi:MAG TPA: hypothetical protein VL069_14495 [Opitutus sp.]|nr:hypothetical protein [Opitutus sp.]
MKHDYPLVAIVVLCWSLAINGVASETSNLEPNVGEPSSADENPEVVIGSPAGLQNLPNRFGTTALAAAELDEFVTGYYRNPQPELIARAIEAFGPSGFVKDRAEVYVGFFAEVLAANPGRIVEWRNVMDRQDRPTRELFKQARRLARPGALLASEGHSVALNDRYWGAFFASGNSEYLNKLVDNLRHIDDEQPPLFWAGATAMWSLARNGPAHPLVEVTLESRQDKTDHPRTREIIGDVLNQNLESIRDKLLARSRELNSADSTHVGHPWSLHDRSGFVGPAAGQPPPKSIWGNR